MAKGMQAVRVLVVDDDQEICEFMETFLSKDGFEVDSLSDAEMAAETVKNGG